MVFVIGGQNVHHVPSQVGETCMFSAILAASHASDCDGIGVAELELTLVTLAAAMAAGMVRRGPVPAPAPVLARPTVPRAACPARPQISSRVRDA